MKKLLFFFVFLACCVVFQASNLEVKVIPESIKKWILEIIQKLGTSALTLILSVLGVKSNLVQISTRDGNILKALFFPAQSSSLYNSQNKPPLIVAITSWALPDFEYISNSVHLSKKGYNVVSYCARGFWNSGDEIHLAGPQDVQDVSEAIDWAEKNTDSDIERVGAMGISYGSGISQMASAFDSRIKAVVALSTWADLAESLFGEDGNTRHPDAVELLKFSADLTSSHEGEEFQELINNYYSNQNIPYLKEYARNRSSHFYVDKINENKPATFLSNAYMDKIFGPDQLIHYFKNKLTVPHKRLQFSFGDHADAELTGIFGVPNHVWEDVYDWFDYYLCGIPNGVDLLPQIEFRDMANSSVIFSYNSWNETTTSTIFLYPDENGSLNNVSPSENQISSIIDDDWPAIATTELNILVSIFIHSIFDILPQIDFSFLPLYKNSAGWRSAPINALRIQSIPTLSLRIKSSRENGTVVAYLYDIQKNENRGYLISYGASSWINKNVTNTFEIDVELGFASYSLEEGNQLGLVVTTKDKHFWDINEGGQIDIIGGSILKVGVFEEKDGLFDLKINS